MHNIMHTNRLPVISILRCIIRVILILVAIASYAKHQNSRTSRLPIICARITILIRVIICIMNASYMPDTIRQPGIGLITSIISGFL